MWHPDNHISSNNVSCLAFALLFQKAVSGMKLLKKCGKTIRMPKNAILSLANSVSSVASMWVYVIKRHWLAKARNYSSASSSGQQACHLCILLLPQHYSIWKTFCAAELSVLPDIVKRINWRDNWRNITVHLGRSRYGLPSIQQNLCSSLVFWFNPSHQLEPHSCLLTTPLQVRWGGKLEREKKKKPCGFR